MEYIKPELECILFDEAEDIILTSGDELINGGTGGENGGYWTDFCNN